MVFECGTFFWAFVTWGLGLLLMVIFFVALVIDEVEVLSSKYGVLIRASFEKIREGKESWSFVVVFNITI